MTAPRELADRLAESALHLVRIPSLFGQEDAIADAVAHRLRQAVPGAWLRRDGNTVAIVPPPDGRPTVALLGHLDTVAPRQDAPPHRDATHVHGCGAADMKSGLAVMLALAEDLDVLHTALRPVWIFYDREEGPYALSGLERVLTTHRDWLAGVALGVCLEPTSGAVQVGSVGTLHATLTFEGRRAHSARPWQGDNAIHKAGTLLSRLAAMPPRPVHIGPLVFHEVFVVTEARGGSGHNVVPDRFELNLNYRFAPGKSIDEACADVHALVGEQARVTFTDLCPSGPPCLDNRWLQALVQTGQLTVASKQAWTDVARLAAYGIEAVCYGPGDTSQAHRRNEHTPIATMVEVHAVLSRWLRTGGTEP